MLSGGFQLGQRALGRPHAGRDSVLRQTDLGSCLQHFIRKGLLQCQAFIDSLKARPLLCFGQKRVVVVGNGLLNGQIRFGSRHPGLGTPQQVS